MEIKVGLGFPSDAIRIREGFGGDENEWLLNHIGNLEAGQTRLVAVINTYYKEVSSKWHLNPHLMNMVADALARADLFVVMRSNLEQCELVPAEIGCALERDREYLLVSRDLLVRGRIRVWGYAGFGGEFYGEDDEVFDMVLPDKCAEEMRRALRSLCAESSVHLREFFPGSQRPTIAKRSRFRVWLERLNRFPRLGTAKHANQSQDTPRTPSP